MGARDVCWAQHAVVDVAQEVPLTLEEVELHLVRHLGRPGGHPCLHGAALAIRDRPRISKGGGDVDSVAAFPEPRRQGLGAAGFWSLDHCTAPLFACPSSTGTVKLPPDPLRQLNYERVVVIARVNDQLHFRVLRGDRKQRAARRKHPVLRSVVVLDARRRATDAGRVADEHLLQRVVVADRYLGTT